MTHHIYLDDTVVIRRRFEIPEKCPRCTTPIHLGVAALDALQLRPRDERLVLTTLTNGKTKQDVVQVVNTAQFGENPRLMIRVRCPRCKHTFAKAHSRTYDLLEMDRLMAFKLRGLLYDSNAADPQVRRKCFEENEGYHGDCMACNIEADIGTEEVPHPIDPRVHTCLRDPEHVQHEPR